MTTTQPPACGKISDERLRQLRTAVECMPLDHTEARDLLAIIDAYRHPAPGADERAAENSFYKQTPLGLKLWLDSRYNATGDLRYIHAGNFLMAYDEANDRAIAALSAQPSGALERVKGRTCYLHHKLECTVCAAYCDEGISPPPERAPGGDAASYHWGNPPFPRWPAETVDSMAEIGEAFMEALPKDYSWCQSPSEIIADLQNQLDDVSAAPPPSSSPSATADATLRAALNDLIRAYVNMLESARERIVAHGGQCDSVAMMERADPRLAAARAALAGNEGEK